MTRARPGCRKRLFLVAGLLLGLGVLLAAVALVIRIRFVREGESLLAAVVADLDRTDPGWRWEDILAGRRALKTEENSAPWVLAAANRIPKDWPKYPAAGREFVPEAWLRDPTKAAEVTLPERLSRWEPVQELAPPLAEEVWAEWDALQPALVLARRLADAPPQGAYPVQWNPVNLYATRLPHPASVRAVGALLHLDAVARTHHGDGANALVAVRGLIKTARSFGDEPALITHQIDLALTRTAVEVTERVLAQGTARPEDLEAVQHWLASQRQALPGQMRSQFRTERGIHHHLFSNAAAGQISVQELAQLARTEQGRWEAFKRWLYEGPLALHAQHLALLEMNGVLKVLDEAPENQLAAAEAWHAGIGVKHGEYKKLGDWHGLSLLVLPALDKVVRQTLHTCAQLDAAILSLAAERYRLAHGGWPNEAADLVPDYVTTLPRDPFDSGRPFRWRRTADGLVIYAVGPDRADNGGNLVRAAIGDSGAGVATVGADVGFRLWDPAHRRQPPPAPGGAQGPAD